MAKRKRNFRRQRHIGELFPIRFNVKDRLFRFIFGEDKEALLQLYNALNGTDYQEPSKLKIMTVKNVIYLSMKNDLAFVIAGVLNLYEQQSSLNPNMPVRFFIYLGEEYQKVLAEYGTEKLYGSKLLKLPAPHCVVFYNGGKNAPEEQILRLSDAFERMEAEPEVELKVRVLNINFGHNQELMEKCHRLWEYAYFVEQMNIGLREGLGAKKAANRAVDRCMEEGVLTDILSESRMEVIGMLLYEYDERKVMKNLWNEGLECGMERGMERGIRAVIECSQELGASHDVVLRQLTVKFSLSREQAETYMDKYWL